MKLRVYEPGGGFERFLSVPRGRLLLRWRAVDQRAGGRIREAAQQRGNRQGFLQPSAGGRGVINGSCHLP